MRLHRNLCFAIIDGVLEVFNDNKYADKVIQSLLKINVGVAVIAVLQQRPPTTLFVGKGFTRKFPKLKNLSAEMMLGGFLQYGRPSGVLNYLTGNILKIHQLEKLKGDLMKPVIFEKLRNQSQTGQMRWVSKNWGKAFGLKNWPNKTNKQM